MRDSSQRDNVVMKRDNGDVFGLALAADFCAEHEWGISNLHRLIGAKQKARCFQDNAQTNDVKVVYGQKKDYDYLLLMGPSYMEWIAEDIDAYLNRNANVWKGQEYEFASAWDEGSFLIKAYDHDVKIFLEDLVDAFENHDVCIWLGGGHVFKNSGLNIAIGSRIPSRLVEDADSVYIDRQNLEEAAEATGIYDILREAGCRFYACSPAWANDDKTEVRFWLNPMDQQDNQYGWYGVEELKQWAEGKGPIIENSDNARKRA